ncbi:diguanylate cyclase, partial [bacterium]
SDYTIENWIREKVEENEILDSLGDGVSVQDRSFRILYQNQAHKNIVGGDRRGEYCYSAYAGNGHVCKGCPVESVFKDGKVHSLEKNKPCRNEEMCLEIKASPLRDSNGRIIAGIEVVRDVSERKSIESALLESEEKYRSLVESSDNSIYLVDKDYRYLFINKKHLKRLGISQAQFKGKSFGDFHMPVETKMFQEKVDTVFKTGNSDQYEYQSLRDGRFFLQTYSPVFDSDRNIKAVTVISKDITERKKMEERLRTLTNTDELTGVYNRRGFFILAEQQLKMASREMSRLFLLSADLDYLKIINDNLGHQAGDQALIETAQILQKSFRDSDIVARIGGDEFVVLAHENAGTNLDMVITRLREHLVSHNRGPNKHYELSFSMGFASYNPESPCSIDELISEADKHMYEEKKQKQR